MNERIRKLLDQMESAERELNKALQERQVHLNFSLKGKRVEFETSVKEAHKQLRIGVLKWLGNRPINLLTAPIIYGMIIPMLLLDLCISFYQATCFPVYKIAKVKRSDFIIFDRHHLSYLNIIEKSHCMYCTYGNGLLAYATEIIARTEQYFCPIKHARKMMGRHARYASFLEYGDPTDYQATCFPVYKIAKVKRSDFIIFDRHHLSYLNIIEKSHCMYCTYGNGLLAYATEIIARTEQYFCPIKHARKMMGRHSRYASFIEYGDPTDYQARLEQFRVDLAYEMEAKDKVVCDGKG